MKRSSLLLSLSLVACAGPKSPSAAVAHLESSPTKTAQRQLPPALDVDPATLTPPPLDFTIREPEITTLPNGVTVYLLEDHSTPLVTLRALVPAGSAEDPSAKLGLAALVASMLREGGAGALEPAALDERLEFAAADLSAGASEEFSTVSLSVRARELAAMLPIFADVVQRPRFDEKRLAITRARFVEGVRRREDRPDAVADRALAKAVFGPTSILGREPTVATLEAITAADLRSFFAANWGPGGARLVITGDVRRDEVLAALATHFGAWRGGTPKSRAWDPPPPLATRVILVPRKVAQAKVRIGTWGFRRATPKEFPLRLVNTALGSFGVGRLYRQIRDERGLAYSAWSSIGAGPTTGLFTAGFDTRPEQVGAALELATKILSGVAATEPPSAAELTTAKDMALNAFAFRFDSAAKIALERATLDLVGYPKDYLATWRAHLAAVDAPTAAAAAKQLGQGLQIVVLGPPEKIGDLSAFGPVTVISDVEQFTGP
ncbi:MAG: M16 family metallopeptidase [Myxococcota bacterium]